MIYCSICGRPVNNCKCSRKVVENRPNEANKIVDPEINKQSNIVTK